MPTTRPAIFMKLVLTALFWGGTWIAGRVVVREISPLAAASWRFFFATLALGALLLAREGRPRWSPRDWLGLGSLGFAGVFLYNLFFLYGMQRVEAGRGALVTAFIPALVALADRLLYRIPMSPGKILGVVTAMFGCLLVVTSGRPFELFSGAAGFGESLLLGTALSWTGYTLLNRHFAPRFSPLSMAFGGCLAGWLMLTAGALAEGSLFNLSAATWRAWCSIGFLGILGTAVAFTWYAEAIGRIGSTRSAAFINLVPVFAVVLGDILLDERLGSAVLAGGALVICGVAITNRSSRRSTER